jgi:hypothetical protein
MVLLPTTAKAISRPRSVSVAVALLVAAEVTRIRFLVGASGSIDQILLFPFAVIMLAPSVFSLFLAMMLWLRQSWARTIYAILGGYGVFVTFSGLLRPKTMASSASGVIMGVHATLTIVVLVLLFLPRVHKWYMAE